MFVIGQKLFQNAVQKYICANSCQWIAYLSIQLLLYRMAQAMYPINNFEWRIFIVGIR